MDFFGNNSPGDIDDPTLRREIRRFEEMQKSNRFSFFDIATLDEIYFWYVEKNKMEDALRVVDFALERYPENDELFFRKATVLFDIGKLNEAETEILEAISRQTQDF